jgi:hypothetical protein
MEKHYPAYRIPCITQFPGYHVSHSFRLWPNTEHNWIEKLLTRQKVIPLSGKVVFIWEKHYPGLRDLACQQPRSRYTGNFRLIWTQCNFSYYFHDKARSRLWTWACSYGQKLSRLARKLFDKFTSEISPCYENNKKSYIAFIWDEKFSRVPRSRLLTGEISVTGIMFFPYEHNFPAYSGITFCRVSNFSIQLMFNATTQPETLPGKRDNVSPYEQNKIIWLVEMFSR